jgi:plastocyanin
VRRPTVDRTPLEPDTIRRTNEAATVLMTGGDTFDPTEVTVRTGDTVVWKNVSRHIHTVTADPSQVRNPRSVQVPDGTSPFHSEEILPDGVYRRAFIVPGTYRYVCVVHEDQGMAGTVIVRPNEPGE